MSYKRILVPIDFSEHSDRALRHAVAIARHEGASITLLHIGMLPHLASSTYGVGAAGSAVLMELAATASAEQSHRLETLARHEIPATLGQERIIREGYPPEEILAQVAEGKHDLVVMGTHGRTGLKRAFMGSVAERVARQAAVPVLIVP